MDNKLCCPLNSAFHLTVSFDGKQEKESHQKVVLKLYSTGHEEEALAEKSLLWPEAELPLDVKYSSGDGIVQLTGVDNVAKIAINMDDMLLARLRSMRSKVEPCPVLKSFSKDHHLFATDAVTTAVINIINAQDVEHSWRELVESLKASDESGIQIVTSQLLHTMFAPWRQQALLNGICNHMESRGDGKTVLSVLVQQRLFTATEVCSRIVELAQRKNWSDIIIHLVRYSLSIDESVYARCLRTAADNLNKLNSDELLLELLNQRVTPETLTERIVDELSAEDASVIISHLITLLDRCQFDDDNKTYANIIELLMILVDGCANKMIWDAKCHEIVRRAANFISEQVQLTDAISSITYQLGNDLSKIIRDDSMRYPDYVIESVPYQCKSL